MALSWNEIKDRAVHFSKEWEGTTNEEAEAKPFLVAFFEVFGVSRKKVATFEERVKKLDESDGYIDLLWKGNLLIEMKSRGKSLDKAFEQAKGYMQKLKQHDLPKYVAVCDFDKFRLYDLEEDTRIDFHLKDLVKNVQHLGFMAGYQKKVYKEEDPVNIEAAELMGKLHDQLKAIGYEGHPLEVYLVRLLFCLFADDTTIFEKEAFREYIEQRTAEDGSDLASKLNEFFFILNTPKEKRLKNLDEQLNEFPYVNGKLFEESLPIASFNRNMRSNLLECCNLDWSKISPAIFGSMFQSVMNPKERRNLGAHYTSEKNILKLIKPLFLDDLRAEFESVKGNKNQLRKFHDKISLLRFLDPACGCGNFLVISYRELRLLEIEIIKTLQKGQQVIDIENLVKLNVDRFYGIEIEEFPAQIAQVALWLTDHQMNMAVSEAFGEYYVRLPLRKSPVIIQGNALTVDWQKLIDPIPWEKKEQLFDFILGNPPFIGSRIMSKEQKEELTRVFHEVKNVGDLDYVTCWYVKAARYIHGTRCKVAFVSTNSIVQGIQVGILWSLMLHKYGIKINFAHRTFKWTNEAKGRAAVYCVILGFANFSSDQKRIFEYSTVDGEPHELTVNTINPYLVEGGEVILERKHDPICNVPEMLFGNMPADGGELLFTEAEKKDFIKEEPGSQKFFRKFVGSEEFINNIQRFCLWLVDIKPDELRGLKKVMERVTKVKKIRENSARPQLARIPHLFAQISQPSNLDYIIVPSVSSERRKYIPIGFESSNVIASNLCLIIPGATEYHFGVLTSEMHMTWVKYTCGRLESRYRYSKDIVYNNYPWPENISTKQKIEVEKAAKNILQIRALFSSSSLADLYDPISMPPQLAKAHQQLDKAVDLCYRAQPFTTEAKRMEFLFELYEKYTSGLFAVGKPKKKAKVS